MPANYVNLFFLCNSVTYPAIKHTFYEGYRAFSSGVYAADWILGWKKAVFVLSFNKLMEGQATSLLFYSTWRTYCTPVSFRLAQKVYWICCINSALRWYTHSIS